MPEAYLFAQGYNFVSGLQLGNFVLNLPIIKEHQVVRYHQYSYNIILSFKPKNGKVDHSQAKELDRLVLNMIKDDRIINSSHGTPYHCSVRETQEPVFTEDSVTFYLNGSAVK